MKTICGRRGEHDVNNVTAEAARSTRKTEPNNLKMRLVFPHITPKGRQIRENMRPISGEMRGKVTIYYEGGRKEYVQICGLHNLQTNSTG